MLMLNFFEINYYKTKTFEHFSCFTFLLHKYIFDTLNSTIINIMTLR